MPSPTTGNLTPLLHCPRCTQPFRIPREKVGALLRCKRCSLHFRLIQDAAGGYVIHHAGAGPVIVPPAAPTQTPRMRPDLPPTTSHPGAPRRPLRGQTAAPPTMQPGQPLPLDVDETMVGQPIPPPNGDAHLPAAVNPPVRGQSIAWTGPFQPTARRVPAGGSKGKVWLIALLAVVVLSVLAAVGYFFPPWKWGAVSGPVSLGKYGGIEIGSTGVKRVGVEYFKTDGGIKEALLDEPRDDNPKLADLPKGATDFDEQALGRTVHSVGDYFESLKNLGVPTENIYIGCSSGVLLPFRADAAALQRNRDRLVKAVRDKTGRDPEFIDAHDEAKFAFEEIVPAEEWADSVLIDVGGGNIKGGGFTSKDIFKEFDVPAGVSSFETTVAKAKRPDEKFADAALRLGVTEIREPLDKQLDKDVPQLLKRKKVHLIGGLTWAMATYTHPVEFYTPAANGSYYCRLAAADLDQFGEMVRGKKPAEIQGEVLAKSAGQKKEVAEAVAQNVEKIQLVFKNPDRLVGGAQILAVLDAKFAVKAENKEVWVFRYGHVAWLLRFVQDRSGHLTETKNPNP